MDSDEENFGQEEKEVGIWYQHRPSLQLGKDMEEGHEGLTEDGEVIHEGEITWLTAQKHLELE